MARSPVFVFALIAGCGDSATPSEPSPSPTPTTLTPVTPPAPEPPPPPAPARYEIHEWGVLDVPVAGAAELAAGPGRPLGTVGGGGTIPTITIRPASARKPVLYVHLLDGLDHLDVSILVRMGGRVMEHWPPTTPVDGGLRWDHVTARAGACTAASYPTRTDERCRHVEDGYCELADLADYVTPDGACLTVGGVETDHLFYRGEISDFALPLEPPAPGARTFRVLRPASLSGRLVHVRRGRVAMLEAPPDTSPIALGTPTEPADRGREQLRTEMRAIGLTEPEIAAFGRAWDRALFPPGEEALLYWLSPDELRSITALHATPAPAAVRRAILVRQAL
jgi:hypothetical protein